MTTKHFYSLGNNSGKTRFVEQMYNPSSDCVAPDAREDFFRAWMELLVSPWSVFQNRGELLQFLAEHSNMELQGASNRQPHTGGCLLEMTKIYGLNFPKIR